MNAKRRAAHPHGRGSKRETIKREAVTNTLVPLGQVASVIRSKIAGPFRITFDVIFPDRETYEAVDRTNVLTKESVAKLYGVRLRRISSFYKVPMANAIKFTMIRELDPLFSTSDSHGAQQHSPLIDMQVPLTARRRNNPR